MIDDVAAALVVAVADCLIVVVVVDHVGVVDYDDDDYNCDGMVVVVGTVGDKVVAVLVVEKRMVVDCVLDWA